MAGGAVGVAEGDEAGRLCLADRFAIGASGVEVAAARGCQRAGDVAFEDLAFVRRFGVGHGDGAEQRLGVGVDGALEDVPFDADQLKCLIEELGEERIEAIFRGEFTPDLSLLGAFATCKIDLSALLGS